METKTCTQCREAKPVIEFSNNRNTKDGKAYMCKPCFNHRYAFATDKTDTERDHVKEDAYIRKMVKNAELRARDKELEFTITKEDIVIPEICPALNMKLDTMGDKDYVPSLDRINNKRGYTPDNIVVVSFRANRLKSDATLVEMTWMAEFYRDIMLDREKALKGEKVLDI